MLYLAVVNVRPGVSILDVQAALVGLDYYRVASNVWVVWSPSLSVNAIAQRLHGCVNPGGTCFVSRLTAHQSQGWMTSEFWTWFNARQ